MKILAIKAPAKGNPVLPRSAADPAHQQGNVNRAEAELKRRFKLITKDLRQLIDDQKQFRTIATNSATYDYEISPERYESINSFIERILHKYLLGSEYGQFNSNWFLRGNLKRAFDDGLTDALRSAQNMATVENVGAELSAAMKSIDVEQVYGVSMINRLGLVYSRVFNEMKGLTDSLKVDLAETLTESMARGLGIRAIAKNVVERTKVGYSRAMRIARTEILTAYRTATRAETKDLNENVYGESDYQMQLLWFSALTSATRKWHASKHGSIVTAKQVEDFYSERGNAINCYCSQSPILVNVKTGEVLQTDLIERMKKQKEAWKG